MKHDGYQYGLASMVYKFFDKKTPNKNKGTKINLDVVSENKQLPKELHKLIIKKFEKQKVQEVQSSFMVNMWGADLADMQLLSNLNEQICFLLCVIATC